MDKDDRRVDVVAEAIYNTHWGEQPTGRFPPHWVDLPRTTKDFVRAQARSAIAAYERSIRND